MTEEKKPFTVSDRRHFTPEGEARAVEEQAPEAPRASAEASPAPRPEPPRPAAPPGEDDEVGGPYPVDFTGLLVSLGTQAAMLLGGGPPGEGPEPDPEGARAFITLLEVLQEKTEGRRTPEENQVLESLLFQLRMEYVSRTQVKGA
jgi:Domain of unknown function (DUF1844)